MKIDQKKSGVIISYISLTLGNIISIAYTPIMLRLLGQNEYGLLNLATSFISYLGFLSFGVSHSYIKYITKFRTDNDIEAEYNLNGMYFLVFSIIGILSLFCGWILIVNLETLLGNNLSLGELNKAKILMLIMTINTAITFPMGIFDMNITSHERFFWQKIIGLIRTILNPLIQLPILLLGFRSVGLTIAMCSLNLLNLIISYWYCKQSLKMKIKLEKFDFFLFKDIFVFSGFIFMNQIVDKINWEVDKVLLGRYQDTAAIAIYSIGVQFNNYFIQFSSLISSVFTPQIHRIVAEKKNIDKKLTELIIKVGRIKFIVLAYFYGMFLFFGKIFIFYWAGEQYNDSYYIALLIMTPILIPLTISSIEVQRAKNKHQFRGILYFVIAILNLIISIPLCKMYGAIGCAIGTSLGMTIGNLVIMNIYNHLVIKLNMILFFKNILSFIPSMTVPFCIGFLINYYSLCNSISELILYGILYTIVFCLSVFYLGINTYEKELLKINQKKRIVIP